MEDLKTIQKLLEKRTNKILDKMQEEALKIVCRDAYLINLIDKESNELVEKGEVFGSMVDIEATRDKLFPGILREETTKFMNEVEKISLED